MRREDTSISESIGTACRGDGEAGKLLPQNGRHYLNLRIRQRPVGLHRVVSQTEERNMLRLLRPSLRGFTKVQEISGRTY